MLARLWRKGNPCALLVGMQTSTATVENSMDVPQKVTNRTTISFSNSTFGYGENENTNSKRYMYPHVHCSIIYNGQDMETT